MPDPRAGVRRAARRAHGDLAPSRSPAYDARPAPIALRRWRTWPRSTTPSCSGCATTCARTASGPCCWACPAASTRPWSRRSPCDALGPRTSSASRTRASGRPSTPRPTRPSSPGAPGCNLDTVPIAPMVDAFRAAVKVDGLAEENLQARIRAVVWMALSNQHGHLVLACGNKSELAVGYSTIYGDAVGGFAPIKDVPKTLVWELAKWRNADAERARRDSRRSPRRDHQAAVGRAAARASSTPTRCPTTTCWTRILDDYVEADRRRAGPGRRGVRPRARRAGRHAGRPGGVQAAAVPAGPEDLAPQLRPRPPPADHQRLARTPLTRAGLPGYPCNCTASESDPPCQGVVCLRTAASAPACQTTVPLVGPDVSGRAWTRGRGRGGRAHAVDVRTPSQLVGAAARSRVAAEARRQGCRSGGGSCSAGRCA